jgi:hypothetical protein
LLDGKTHSLEVGNRPVAYILEVEEEERYTEGPASTLGNLIAGESVEKIILSAS